MNPTQMQIRYPLPNTLPANQPQGSVVVAAEAAKRVMANSDRKTLEERLGRNMPAGYRMYKQNTR